MTFPIPIVMFGYKINVNAVVTFDKLCFLVNFARCVEKKYCHLIQGYIEVIFLATKIS